MTEHAPMPWTAGENSLGAYPIFAKQGPLTVQPAKAFSEADAAFIIKAVNSHDELVKEVEYLRTLLRNAVHEFPVASGVLADSDGLAGYGSLKAMRLHLKIEPKNRPCDVGGPGRE